MYWDAGYVMDVDRAERRTFRCEAICPLADDIVATTSPDGDDIVKAAIHS